MKASEIPEGEGVAGQIGLVFVAVRKSEGAISVLENVCTHMGCHTAWNSKEQIWDCPCHGSRYHADGTVLRGPAPLPLPHLDFHVEGDEIVLD